MTYETNTDRPLVTHLYVIGTSNADEYRVGFTDSKDNLNGLPYHKRMSTHLCDEIIGVLTKYFKMTDDTITGVPLDEIVNYIKSYIHVEQTYKFDATPAWKENVMQEPRGIQHNTM